MEAVIQAQEGASPLIDKRGARRFSGEDVPSITSVRVSPLGIQARLVDISETGILLECTTRIQPRSSVNLSFDGTSGLSPTAGRVARTTVAALDSSGSLRYHVGIAFTASIPMVSKLVQGTPAKPPSADPSHTLDAPPPAAAPSRVIPRNRW